VRWIQRIGSTKQGSFAYPSILYSFTKDMLDESYSNPQNETHDEKERE
jgi:hypothetical protein